MKLTKQNVLHWAIVGAFLCSLGVCFDAWWHISRGRDTFFALPHLVLHGGILILLITSLRAWQEFKMKGWKKIFLTFFIIPLSLPFDELWHYFRGKESIDSILIVWSPPHLALFLSAVVGMYLISRELQKEKDMVAKEIYGAALLGSIASIAFVIAGPVFPFSQFAIFGFYGAAVTTFIKTWVFFYARRILPHTFPAFLTAIFTVILLSIMVDSVAAYGSRAVGQFPLIPNWILNMAVVALAILIDSRMFKNNILLGAVGGLVSGFIMYTLSLNYIDPAFRHGGTAIIIALASSIVGGALAGYVQPKK